VRPNTGKRIKGGKLANGDAEFYGLEKVRVPFSRRVQPRQPGLGEAPAAGVVEEDAVLTARRTIPQGQSRKKDCVRPF
jgi:hypothetical protein